jgi:hypothetical protein
MRCSESLRRWTCLALFPDSRRFDLSRVLARRRPGHALDKGTAVPRFGDAAAMQEPWPDVHAHAVPRPGQCRVKARWPSVLRGQGHAAVAPRPTRGIVPRVALPHRARPCLPEAAIKNRCRGLSRAGRYVTATSRLLAVAPRCRRTPLS